MAITRAQQARQMLKKAGAVEQDGVMNYITNSESVTVPKEFKARKNAPATKLAYITAAEAKMLKNKKPGTPHKGPKGIPSYDSFDAKGNFTSGAAMSAAETGGKTERDRADMRAAGMSPQRARDLRSAAIAAGAGQRVNPGFFDSRNLVSPADLAAARAIAPKAFARSRGSGIMNFIRGGGLFGNLIRGLGQRFGFGRKFNEPSFDMSKFANLPLGGSASFQNLDIRDIYDRRGTDDEDENMNLNDFVGLTNLDFIDRISERDMSLTPEQQQLIQDQNVNEQLGDIRDIMAADGGMIGGGIMDAAGRQQYFLGKLVKKAKRAVKKIVKSPLGKLGLGAALAFTPFGKTAIGKFAGLSTPMKALIGGAGLSALPLIFGQEEEQGEGLETTGSVGGQIDPRAYTDPRSVMFRAFRMAEGGRIGLKEGEGIMKVASAPDIMDSLNDLAQMLFGKNLDQLTDKEYDALQDAARDSMAEGGRIGLKEGEGIMKMASAVGDETDEISKEMFGKPVKDLNSSELEELREYLDNLRTKFMAEGGSMKEPVAKKTMPLLDMDGQEMDLRAEGGFVPIGRMEKADDVPARLSKNEFVFTADAVRNAGEGDVDKGAEVMYNMMKNLESGGEVSEESQGLEGARNMFQTSKRLEEVI